MRLAMICWLGALAGVSVGDLRAQVTIDPARIEPAAWTPLDVRVVNLGDAPWATVRVYVPEAIGVLGVAAPPNWSSRRVPPTDSTPQVLEWSGGEIPPGGLAQFSFMGRLGADVPRRELRFPVDLITARGDTLRLRRRGDGPEPSVLIVGTTRLSPWAAFALAGGAFGLATLALVLAIRRPTP